MSHWRLFAVYIDVRTLTYLKHGGIRYVFLAIDWDGLFEAKYIKVFLVVAIIAQATLFIIKKIGAVLYCGMFASLTISVLGMIENLYLYAYLAIMIAAMFGITKRYHR